MLERNFNKAENGGISVQEALAASKLERQNKDKDSKFIKKAYKADICNYCHRTGRWIRLDTVKKWISDRKPVKKSPSITILNI